MANVTLNTGDEITLGAGTHTIDGSGKVSFSSTNASAVFNSAGAVADTLSLAGASTDYNVSKDGTNLVLTHKTTGKAITIASGATGDTVTFSNGSLTLQYVTGTGVKLGTQTVATTAATITDTPTGAGSGTTTGQSFSLTTAADISGVMVGSAGTTTTTGNDTFTATNLTYNTTDVLVGGEGTDTLTITATGAVGAASSVVGIEAINVSTSGMITGASYDAAGVVGTGTTITVANTQAGSDGSFAITNLGTGATVAAASNVTGTLSVTTTAAATQTLTLAANSATTQTVVLTQSGATDVATLTAAGTVGLTATNIETLNFSGNGAAATYTMASALGATATNLTGTQSVTLAGNESSFDGKTINDNTTGGTTTLKITTSGDSDLSKAAVDVVDLAVVSGAQAYTLRNGQAFNVTAIPTGDITLDINDQVAAYTNGAVTVDLGVLLSTGSGLAVTATSATSDNISTLNITNSTVAQTALEVLATADTAVVISGTKAVTLETASTAKSISATGLSAALTVNYDGTSDVATVTGGSGNDVFAFASAYNAGAVTIDGGAGLGDKITLAASESLNAATLSNLEVIDLSAAGNTIAADFNASQLSGKTYAITGAGTDDTIEINANLSIDTMTIDLSKLVIDTTNVVSITIDGTKVSADFGTSAPQTFTGSSTKDIYTAGQGADNITGGNGADSITGGNGADVISLTEATAASDTVVFTVTETGGADRITGFNPGATTGDIIYTDAFVLLKGSDGSTTLSATDGTDQLTSATLVTVAATNAALTGTGTGVYVFSTDVGGSIDFSTATDAQIVTALETGLAATTGNVLSGTATSAVTNGAASTALLLGFYDGANTSIVKYVESGADASFAGELTVVAVLNGVNAANLTYDNFFA